MRAVGCTLVIVSLAALSGLLVFGASAALAEPVLPPGFQDTELHFEGFPPDPTLEQPTAIRFASNGEVFIALKAGEILRYKNVNDPTPSVFADLRTEVYDHGDRGLLGLALDPKFTEGHPYVYALYAYDHILGESAPAPKWGLRNHAGDECPEGQRNEADDCLISGRLVRLTAEPNHEHAVKEEEVYEEEGEQKEEEVPAEMVLVEGWCQQFSSHSVGDLQFGPEGDLYASGGEGGNFVSPDYGQFGESTPNPCGDPPAGAGGVEIPPTTEGGSLRSQNPKVLSGKVIRINPETGKGVPGNPLYESSDENEQRIIGEGFRNPFRFTIDPKTDELYVGNVGWNTYEEIDRFAPPSGETPGHLYNSGWPCYEGPELNPGFAFLELNVCEALINTPNSTSKPYYYYEHGIPLTPEDPCSTEFGSAITGSTFYEGNAYPEKYKGALFFADSVRQCIYVMLPGKDGEPDPSMVKPFLTNGGLYPGIDIQEGPEGNLYYVKLYGPNYSPGSIHRITYSSGNLPPVAHLKVDHNFSPGDLTAEFSATESSDPNGEKLEYEWDPEWEPQGTNTFEPATKIGTKTLTFNDSVNHTVAVRVKDEQGAISNVAEITVYPHDTPPIPEILEPVEGSEAGKAELKWHVGEPIEFSGTAHNETEELPATDLSWSARLYHCPAAGCHVHPLQTFPNVASGSFEAPEHDYPSQLELELTATDSRGLSASKTLHLYPKTAELQMHSQPSGIDLTSGLLTEPAPFTVTAIEGSNLTLAAPKTAHVGETTYAWSGWSDGGERVHSVLAEGTATYTAEYMAPEARLQTRQLGGSPSNAPLQVELDATGSTENGEGLEYEWDTTGDGSFEAPTTSATKRLTFQDEASHSVAVRVRDHRGASSVAKATLHAVAVQLESEPGGLTLTAGAFTQQAPFTLTVLGGTQLTLAAPETVEVGGITYIWHGWSDGGARIHSILAEHPIAEKAVYEEVAPQTALGKHPRSRTRSRSAKFAFSSNESGALFQCKLDKGSFRPCSSPRHYRHLKRGKHLFEVIAVDPGGKADQTPSKFSWKVL